METNQIDTKAPAQQGHIYSAAAHGVTCECAGCLASPGGVLKVGRRKFNVQNFADASRVYSQMRDASGEGASTWRDGSVTFGGLTYRISYNGRVWADKSLTRCVWPTKA